MRHPSLLETKSHSTPEEFSRFTREKGEIYWWAPGNFGWWAPGVKFLKQKCNKSFKNRSILKNFIPGCDS